MLIYEAFLIILSSSLFLGSIKYGSLADQYQYTLITVGFAIYQTVSISRA